MIKHHAALRIVLLLYKTHLRDPLLQLSGLLILATGLWTILDKHHYVSLLSSNTYVATTYLLIATGGFILIVGIFGCCGAWKENRICLMAVGGAGGIGDSFIVHCVAPLVCFQCATVDVIHSQQKGGGEYQF